MRSPSRFKSGISALQPTPPNYFRLTLLRLIPSQIKTEKLNTQKVWTLGNTQCAGDLWVIASNFSAAKELDINKKCAERDTDLE